MSKVSSVFIAGFVLFLIFLNYQFAMDFILVNKYVWSRSQELASQTEPNLIQGTNAWKMTHRNLAKNYIYNFSYDSLEVNEGYACCYDLVETKEINFPFSIFVEPKIYLYKLK